MLTAEELRARLHYDPESGIFTWRASTRAGWNGREAGCVNDWGYLVIRIAGRGVLAHRLAWLYMYGMWPEKQIDHINRDKLDNRIANLRDVEQTANQHNRCVARADNKSGRWLGVSFQQRSAKWVAQIQTESKRYFLGYHSTPEAAHEAYLEAKHRLHTPAAHQI